MAKRLFTCMQRAQATCSLGIVGVVTIRDTSTVHQAGLSHSESGWWPLESGRPAIYYKSCLMLPRESRGGGEATEPAVGAIATRGPFMQKAKKNLARLLPREEVQRGLFQASNCRAIRSAICVKNRHETKNLTSSICEHVCVLCVNTWKVWCGTCALMVIAGDNGDTGQEQE